MLEVGQLTLTATTENGGELILPVPAAGRGDREGEVADPLHAVLAVHILGGGGRGGGTLRDSEGGTAREGQQGRESKGGTVDLLWS